MWFFEVMKGLQKESRIVTREGVLSRAPVSGDYQLPLVLLPLGGGSYLILPQFICYIVSDYNSLKSERERERERERESERERERDRERKDHKKAWSSIRKK